MVIAYLEKIRERFIEEQVDVQAKLTEKLILQKENIQFIKLLEENTDSNFEAFTPRTVNSFHKRKIEELKIELKTIEIDINELELSLQNIENELEEINIVLKDTKEKLENWCFL